MRIDESGIVARCDAEIVLDVRFDDRRIWSFWLWRDGEKHDGAHFVAWPADLCRFLDGVARVTLAEHHTGCVLFDEDLRLGAGSGRIAVVDQDGLPLSIDKSRKLKHTFETRTTEHVAPLLDSIEDVLAALGKAGVDAFPAYGTLLGAVREARLIGHDSDADLGYVSHHRDPVDVALESFRLQRALSKIGYSTSRYSAASFRIDIHEADGSVRGLDVFGGFFAGGNLHLMGRIRVPFRQEWIFPLGTCTLEGRELPAPADPDRFLSATYGPQWRVPDPAYQVQTPRGTHSRLDGWFRGTRVGRMAWEGIYRRTQASLPELEPSDLARWVLAREGVPTQLVDLGCGRGADAYWMAGQGSHVIGLDYVLRATEAVGRLAAQQGLPLEFRTFNLVELRSVLGGAARIAHTPGPRIVTARHVADATDATGRGYLWRAAQMMLRDGGRLYLEFLAERGPRGDFARARHLHPVRRGDVVAELEGRGGTVVDQTVEEVSGSAPGGRRRIARLVVEWQRNAESVG